MAWVDVQFDCLPLRSISRFDLPWDAPPEVTARYQRVLQAATKHGLHNSYYLHDASCIFHLTNDERVGMIEFAFEGTVLTDHEDCATRGSDLQVSLTGETCDWLTQSALAWFVETVTRAVEIEFDRFIAAGDLARTKERIAQLQQQSDALGGFFGMGL